MVIYNNLFYYHTVITDIHKIHKNSSYGNDIVGTEGVIDNYNTCCVIFVYNM